MFGRGFDSLQFHESLKIRTIIVRIFSLLLCRNSLFLQSNGLVVQWIEYQIPVLRVGGSNPFGVTLKTGSIALPVLFCVTFILKSLIMKKVLPNILIATFIFLSACSSTKNAPSITINAVLEDHSSSAFDFPKGVYYSFKFSEDPVQQFDVNQLIDQLTMEKIPVTDLWYKAGSRSCLPPGSDMAMQVIVEPVLLIRLEKENEKLAGLGFLKTFPTDMGECAYRVKRFRF